MPISLFPEDRRRFWLKCDAEIPMESRPVFVCNAPTRKLMIQWSQLYDEAINIREGPEAYEKLHQMIELGVKDWRNFGKPFNRESLDEILSNGELQEVAFDWPNAFKLSEEDRKGFTLPQPSAADNSAPSATTDATNPPQQNSPSTSG